MTRKSGMLWKTPWRRRTGGLVSQPPVQMWFFDLGGANAAPALDYWFFQSPAQLPSFAAGPGPFWYGLVCRGATPTPPTLTELQGRFSQESFVPNRGFSLSIQNLLVPPDTESALLQVATMATGISVYATDAVLDYDWSTVTVVFVRVTPQGGTTQTEVWFDNQWYKSVTGPAPYAQGIASILLGGNRYIGSPTLHGAVGGLGPVTDEQVSDWFTAVKVGAQIVGIPGQTTDLWSAAAVAPAVPNPLPNMAGGQNLNHAAIGVPLVPPSNVLMSVSFNY